jgi:glycosyltransferase involved in cell wall biosynthesis
MRITFLLTQSLESPSGLGRYWPVAKALQQRGYRVTLLALHHNWEGLTRRRFVREGVHVWYVGQMHVRKVGNHKYYFRPLRLLWIVVRATWGLLWAALRVPTDIYHVCKPQPMNSIAGLLARWLRHKPLYLDCDDYETGSNTFNGAWQRRVVAFFEDRVPRFARGITVNTHFTAARLEELGYPPERVVRVPNGVERKRFAEAATESLRGLDALRESLGLVDKRVVLYLGSMSLTNHAVDLLLEAFVQVRAQEPRAMLLLVGGGEDFDVLRGQALDLGKAVRFVGRVDPAQAPLYYRLAVVSVDPVYDDAVAAARFPLKVVESWAAGVPVVTGNVGDRAALLAKGGGLLVPAGDADALAKAITKLLSDEETRAAQAARARDLRARYCWDRLVTLWALVYAELSAMKECVV